jgi:hypothetical protein
MMPRSRPSGKNSRKRGKRLDSEATRSQHPDEAGETRDTRAYANSGNSQQIKLLTSVRDYDWRPSAGDDLEKFSNTLITSIDKDLERRFARMILARLYFQDFSDRFENIAKAHESTFRWMFEDNPEWREPGEWDSFPDWLASTEGSNMYWVTGKPGSGKSTLMKYLFNHESTTTTLQAWSKGVPLVKAGFFFWNSGTVMQMSRMALLQTLLYSALSKDNETLVKIFKYRWEQFLAFGGGRQPFTWAELLQAFQAMVSDTEVPRNYFFVIDGLDEFDGESKELVDLVFGLVKHPHVKVCTSSRPWIVFRDAFGGQPSLLLEQLTRLDIHHYVASNFEGNIHYVRLRTLEPTHASKLIEDLTNKADGIFLWVYLVVQSLLDGLSNADRMTDLVARLEALPPGLERLFDRLLKSLEPRYYKHACQLFRLVLELEIVNLLELWFADNEDHNSAMKLPVQLLSPDERGNRIETMNRRIVARCKGFLEVDYRHLGNTGDLQIEEISSITAARHHLNRGWYQVYWIHRTARDFLLTQHMHAIILEATGYTAFDPVRHWANGFLGVFKSIDGISPDCRRTFWGCIEFALRIQSKSGTCPVDYLNEVGQVVESILKHHPDDHDLFDHDRRERVVITTFFDFAAWCNLVEYVRTKARDATKDELLQATKCRSSKPNPLTSILGMELHEVETLLDDFESAKQMDLVLKQALHDKKETYRQRWERQKKNLFKR